jgi:hypothetical protein
VFHPVPGQERSQSLDDAVIDFSPQVTDGRLEHYVHIGGVDSAGRGNSGKPPDHVAQLRPAPGVLPWIVVFCVPPMGPLGELPSAISTLCHPAGASGLHLSRPLGSLESIGLLPAYSYRFTRPPGRPTPLSKRGMSHVLACQRSLPENQAVLCSSAPREMSRAVLSGGSEVFPVHCADAYQTGQSFGALSDFYRYSPSAVLSGCRVFLAERTNAFSQSTASGAFRDWRRRVRAEGGN